MCKASVVSTAYQKKGQGVSVSFIPDHKSYCYSKSLCVNTKRRHRFLDSMTSLADYNMNKIRPFFEHTECLHHADLHNVISNSFHYFW